VPCPAGNQNPLKYDECFSVILLQGRYHSSTTNKHGLFSSWLHRNWDVLGLPSFDTQRRRHGFESGGGDNFASGASEKNFFDPPLFGQWGGQNIA